MGPVSGVVPARHLHEIERDVAVEEDLNERLGSIDQSVVSAEIDIDVWELAPWYPTDQGKRVVLCCVLGTDEWLTERRTLDWTAEPFNTDLRVWSSLPHLPLGLIGRGRGSSVACLGPAADSFFVPSSVLECAAVASDRHEQVRMS